MKTENIKTNKTGTEKVSIPDTEAHSYNNPGDLDGIMAQEVEALYAAKEKITHQAAYLDVVQEDGLKYAIVKNSLDNTVILKTGNPKAIEFLFEKAD